MSNQRLCILRDKRDAINSLNAQRSQANIWSILKHSLGTDLSRLSIPVVFNEPLTFLQRISEYMEYSDLISKAVNETNPLIPFAVSALASNWQRVGKPFNPILGETYELDHSNTTGFRICCEQVSHHPPISAFHVEGDGFKFYGSIHPKIKLKGQGLEIVPKGILTLELLKQNDVYMWSNVNCSVKNIIIGKMQIELQGTMEIVSHRSGLKCTLQFKPNSCLFGREISRHVHGFIVNQRETRLRTLYGDWTEFLASCTIEIYNANFEQWLKLRQKRNSPNTVQSNRPASPVTFPGSNILWQIKSRPDFSEGFFNFTEFAMGLNDMQSNNDYAPTDSRFRPDVRYLENGELDLAETEKLRLEEKQRFARSLSKETKRQWTPKHVVYNGRTSRKQGRMLDFQ
ncbi:Oxysterol-binding protein-related protein 2 [Trichinella britovi]|uniref:Oxysterol-binding protein n=1 Tax=Trichinella britovi TaxID=45882 RepID=A0A0V1DBP1_TRIBR|nr:Oxysterol-binding protein-related protein 2 [Trichinella britovi]KRZ91708.1 Oxysterol-binding protein-related protein 2 [Trichinella sp. T8]